MKSLEHIAGRSAAFPLAADEITELHAVRLLLLLRKCGTHNRIEGLMKLAKLDFLVRYPRFFNELARHLQKSVTATTDMVESGMVRHHYGPWDRRYYMILPFLEARNLVSVSKEGRAYVFALTEAGKSLADSISKNPAFSAQVEQMKQVKHLVGRRSGTSLKNLIYDVFDAEIAQRPLGETIQ